jgi:hypothetical protein
MTQIPINNILANRMIIRSRFLPFPGHFGPLSFIEMEEINVKRVLIGLSICIILAAGLYAICASDDK